MKSMCLPSSVKRWMRLLVRSATSQDRLRRRACPTMIPCGQSQLAGFLARTAEGADVFALAVVLIDVARAVAVANIDIAIGRNCEIRGAVFDLLAVSTGL